MDSSLPTKTFTTKGVVDNSYLTELAQKALSTVEEKESEQIRKAIGFHVDTQKRIIQVPVEFFTNTDTIAEIVSVLALRTGYAVSTYDSGLNCSVKQIEEDFAYGILRAVVKPDFCRFTAGKKERDLGFAITMALRMKCAFESVKRVDELTANNYYFGNNPGEKVYIQEKKKYFDVSYSTRARIVGIIASSDAGELFFRTISHFFKELQWNDVPEEVRDKYDFLYTKKFDEVVQYGWQYVYQKKGNARQLAMIRKGSMPNRSSLFLKEEMKILNIAMSPSFESLSSLKSNFFDHLSNLGLPKIKEIIQKVYKRRFAILERFASETTKRLNQIRLLNPDLKSKKKKEITNAMVTQLLCSRQDPAKVFRSEIKSIIGHDNMKDVYCAFELKFNGLPETGSIVLSNQIIDSYISLGIYKDKNQPITSELTVMDKYVKDLEDAVKVITGFRGSMSICKRLLNRFLEAKTPEGRGYFRPMLTNNIDAWLVKTNLLVNYDLKMIDLVERSSGTFTDLIDDISMNEIRKILSVLSKGLTKHKSDNKTLVKEADTSLLAIVKEARDRLISHEVFKQV